MPVTNVKEKKTYEFPYEIIDLDKETQDKLLVDFKGTSSYVQVGPDKYLYPSSYREHVNNFYNFEARPDDIWIVALPRTGTTRTQELIWIIANNFNYEQTKKDPLTKRFPFYEGAMLFGEDVQKHILANCANSIFNVFFKKLAKSKFNFLSKIKSPRFIKTHFPFSLLPPSIAECNAKVIYVARNPKDIAVSLYYFSRLFKPIGFTGDFPSYWNYLEKDLCIWLPYWAHVKEGWARRNDPNVLFLFYEEMNKDVPAAIKKIANFLEKPITEEQTIKLTNYLSFENFRENKSVNFSGLEQMGVFKKGEENFIRKGKIGGWREEFSPELNEQADRWIEMHLKDTDLTFHKS